MDEVAKNWLNEIAVNRLDDEDVRRSLAYAKDLERGLATIRTYPQGVTIFGSARLPDDDEWCILARKLGQKLAEHGHPVTTGGGPGIMEAANRGAYEAGGRSIGLNITLPHEQHANPYLTDSMEFHYFFARKVMLAFSAKAFVFFPGGFGTMDEFTEIILLMQEDKMPKMPTFLIGESFWKPLDKFFKTRLASNRLIKPEDRSLYTITDNISLVVKAADKIGHGEIRERLGKEHHKHL
jgi:hypothetical protein